MRARLMQARLMLIARASAAIGVLAAPVGAAVAAAAPAPAPTVQVDGQVLVLNGSGVRSYSVFGIEIYAAALYLPARESSGPAVLAGPRPVVIDVRMLRAVSREDSVKAWAHYQRANCSAPCVLAPDALEGFLQRVPAAEEGALQRYVFRADRVELFDGERSLGSVVGGEFARTVLATWLGAVPSSPALKRALLRPPP